MEKAEKTKTTTVRIDAYVRDIVYKRSKYLTKGTRNIVVRYDYLMKTVQKELKERGIFEKKFEALTTLEDFNLIYPDLQSLLTIEKIAIIDYLEQNL